jgi:hypothetical protein
MMTRNSIRGSPRWQLCRAARTAGSKALNPIYQCPDTFADLFLPSLLSSWPARPGRSCRPEQGFLDVCRGQSGVRPGEVLPGKAVVVKRGGKPLRRHPERRATDKRDRIPVTPSLDAVAVGYGFHQRRAARRTDGEYTVLMATDPASRAEGPCTIRPPPRKAHLRKGRCVRSW